MSLQGVFGFPSITKEFQKQSKIWRNQIDAIEVHQIIGQLLAGFIKRVSECWGFSRRRLRISWKQWERIWERQQRLDWSTKEVEENTWASPEEWGVPGWLLWRIIWGIIRGIIWRIIWGIWRGRCRDNWGSEENYWST